MLIVNELQFVHLLMQCGVSPTELYRNCFFDKDAGSLRLLGTGIPVFFLFSAGRAIALYNLLIHNFPEMNL